MLSQMADPKEPTPNDPEKPDTDAADTGGSPEDVAMDRTAAAGGGAEQSASGGQKSSETREKMSSAARSAQDRASKAASAARKWVARCARGGAWSARALASKRLMRSMVLVGRLASSARSAVVLGDDRVSGKRGAGAA